jgi:hypothetical protein
MEREKKLIRAIKIFNWRVKLNWKVDLIERKTNQKKDGQTRKKNNKKIDWIMKLKANKTSTKVSRRKKKGPNEKQNI